MKQKALAFHLVPSSQLQDLDCNKPSSGWSEEPPVPLSCPTLPAGADGIIKEKLLVPAPP